MKIKIKPNNKGSKNGNEGTIVSVVGEERNIIHHLDRDLGGLVELSKADLHACAASLMKRHGEIKLLVALYWTVIKKGNAKWRENSKFLEEIECLLTNLQGTSRTLTSLPQDIFKPNATEDIPF